ncbi:hypothetical protein FRB98_008884 [Tulasnella sp. 332]|nr:hypothetical protein FRB98_008884 [Tulasnella sp. 332]
MKLIIVTAIIMPILALAAPGTLVPRALVYDPTNAPAIFTDPTCTLSKSLTAGEPLSFEYPTAEFLGTIFGPVLNLLIGHATVEDIDSIADQLCFNAAEDPRGGDGICQDALQATYDLATATDPQLQADKYKCLLNLLCIAPAVVPYEGTCQYLLAGSDCIANRIVQTNVLECNPGDTGINNA